MALTAYIKPTNFCTIGCEHCYLPEDVRANKESMSDETIASTAKLLLDLAKREGHDSLHIIWHGGEAMMLPPEWYWNAISILDNEIGRDKYTQSFQTSLIPYRSAWKKIIEERFDSFIGSSIDFTQRKVKSSSDAYLDLWLKKVGMARKDGFVVIPSMVPTKFEIGKGKAIVNWFEENNFPAFNIERFTSFGGTSIEIPSNKQHAAFMIEVFDAVLENIKLGKRVSQINVITSAINGVLHGIPGDRWGGSCQREFLVIEPDGSLNTCPDRASHEKPFSNVSDGAKSFITSPDRRNWIRIQNIGHKKSYCHSCEFNSWCKSACPITPNGHLEGENDCSGYKTYLDHVKNVLCNPENRELLSEYATPKGEPILALQKLIS